MQNTIKALISCIDDVTTSFDIKLSCLKLVQKFITYVTDDDFQTLDFEDEQISYKKITNADNKNEWFKIVASL